MAEKKQERYEDSFLYRIRHSCAHVMAQAVVEMMPEAKYTIGPPVENGFYYDFDCDHALTQEDLPLIEKKMIEIVKANKPFVRKELPREEAVKYFQDRDETYKVELINDITDDTVSIYEEGDFVDLCRGPHLESTGKVKAFKLLSVAGAYWRGMRKTRCSSASTEFHFRQRMSSKNISIFLKK
jgi:threonyl-tRNA synthetase